jgi:hypothetical protein
LNFFKELETRVTIFDTNIERFCDGEKLYVILEGYFAKIYSKRAGNGSAERKTSFVNVPQNVILHPSTVSV